MTEAITVRGNKQDVWLALFAALDSDRPIRFESFSREPNGWDTSNCRFLENTGFTCHSSSPSARKFRNAYDVFQEGKTTVPKQLMGGWLPGEDSNLQHFG